MYRAEMHATEKYQIARETYANLSHVIMIRRNCDGDRGEGVGGGLRFASTSATFIPH